LEVTVVSPPNCRFVRELPETVELVPLPTDKPFSSPPALSRSLSLLSNLIGSGRFSVIHSIRETAQCLAVAANRGRLPLIHLRSGTKAPRANRLQRYLYRNRTRAVVVSSRQVEQWMVSLLGMPPERVHRILAGVDTERHRPREPDPTLRDELGIPSNRFILLCLARLAPVKGHSILLEALARIRRRFPDVVLVSVGIPWEGQPTELLAQAERLGLAGSVFFPGWRSDIERFLSIANAGVLGSIGSEENSRATEEYLASGLPVVATTVGVIPELVREGETGFLAPPRDPAALAEGVIRLLDAPDLARRMGKAARQDALKRFSRQEFARRLGQVLEAGGISVLPCPTPEES